MTKKSKKLSKSVYDQAYNSRDKGNTSKQGYIDWDKCSHGRKIKFYNPEEGINKINIIPFEIKSKKHPLVKLGRMSLGSQDIMLDIWVHRFVGPSNNDVVCPKQNYNKGCPICEESSKYYKEGKKKEASKLRASRRVLLNVQPIIDDVPSSKLCVFDVSHWLFMKELIEEAHACVRGEDIIRFADIEDGKIVKFRAKEEDFENSKMIKFKSFSFPEREEELDEDIIKQAISFDEGIINHTYEEIEKIFYGQDDEDEDDDYETKKETSKKRNDEEEDEEEEEKIKPRRKNRLESEEDEEEEDEPKKRKEKSNKNKCPLGFKFGTVDDHDECDICKLWDDCIDEKHKIRKRRIQE